MKKLTQLKGSPGMWLACVVIILWVAGSMMGQLQQSGGPGSTVTVSSGTVTANQGGTWTVQPGNTANTTAWKVDGSAVVQPASQSGTWTVQPGNTANTTAWKVDGSAVTQPVSGTVAISALPTGSNVIGTVNTIPKTACGNVLAAGSTLAAVPTSSTLITSAATACAVVLLANNTNGSAATVTFTDNTGTPINDILTFSIPPNSQLIQPLYGVAFNLGIRWFASGAGITGAVVAYQ